MSLETQQKTVNLDFLDFPSPVKHDQACVQLPPVSQFMK